MTEGAVAAFSVVDFLYRFPFNVGIGGNHHLANALAGIDYKRFLGQIDKNYLNFATKIGIHRAGRVHDTNAVFERKTTAGTDLQFVSLRQLHAQPCGNKHAFERLEHYGVFDSGMDVHTCSRRGLVGRKRPARFVYYLYFE